MFRCLENVHCPPTGQMIIFKRVRILKSECTVQTSKTFSLKNNNNKQQQQQKQKKAKEDRETGQMNRLQTFSSRRHSLNSTDQHHSRNCGQSAQSETLDMFTSVRYRDFPAIDWTVVSCRVTARCGGHQSVRPSLPLVSHPTGQARRAPVTWVRLDHPALWPFMALSPPGALTRN